MAEDQEPMRTFKCVLLGDAGRTMEALVEHLVYAGFSQKELSPQGVEIRSLVFYTTRGPLRFCVWNAAGEEMFEALRQGPRIEADCAIILFDSENSDHEDLLKEYRNTPTILCGSKADLKVLIKRKSKLQYFFDITSNNRYSFVYPFLWLSAHLLDDLEVEVVPMPAPYPTEVKLTAEELLKMKRSLEEAQEIPLPEDLDNW